jgi:hypothetical protein
VDVGEAFAESFFERLHKVAVGAGQEAIEKFDDGDFGAQLGINGSHFEADVAAADHQE